MRDYRLLSVPNPGGNRFTSTREPCQHGFTPNQLPHLIVIHTGENTPDFVPPDTGAENLARWASNPNCKVSWHASTDSDSIVWMLPPSYEAWHVRNYNDCGYGIEQATKAASWVETPWAWREAMLRNTAKVVAEVALENNIPLKWLTKAEVDAGARGVCSHAILDPTRRSDPGASYPYAWMLERAKEYQNPTVDEPAVPKAGTAVMGQPVATVDQAIAWALAGSARRDGAYPPEKLKEIVRTYWRVGIEYGVRPDLALAQSAKETGFWSYQGAGGDPSPVRPEQFNFAGIGATGGIPGNVFSSIEAGVRAHVLRMRMYAVNDTTYYNPLVLGRALPSSHWGKYPNIEDFNGVWATPGFTYGQSIVSGYLEPMIKIVPQPEVPQTLEQRVLSLEERVGRLESGT